jgi:hypothetical protein
MRGDIPTMPACKDRRKTLEYLLIDPWPVAWVEIVALVGFVVFAADEVATQ